MPELEEIYEFIQTALRSVGAEITSPWFYFQLGIILAGADQDVRIRTVVFHGRPEGNARTRHGQGAASTSNRTPCASGSSRL